MIIHGLQIWLHILTVSFGISGVNYTAIATLATNPPHVWQNIYIYIYIAQKRSERSHERWRPCNLKTNYPLLNSQACAIEATLSLLLKKITSEVKFAERKSVLFQNSKVWKKNMAFVQIQCNPAVNEQDVLHVISGWYRRGTLRDETKNGCVAYHSAGRN